MGEGTNVWDGVRIEKKERKTCHDPDGGTKKANFCADRGFGGKGSSGNPHTP